MEKNNSSKLTPRELEIKNELYNQYKLNKKKFVKDYGKNAEKVMVGRAIKLAKNMAKKENKQKIKETIKTVLSRGPVEEINSAEYVQTRQPIKSDTKENPIDIVKMDIPLLLRVMEYAKEDAKTDMDLHVATENMIELSKEDRVLTMDDYNNIVAANEEKPLNELVKSIVNKLNIKK